MKKIFLDIISLFAIIKFSSNASAIEYSNGLSNNEYDAYIEARQLSKQILYHAVKYGKSTSIKIGWFTTCFNMV